MTRRALWLPAALLLVTAAVGACTSTGTQVDAVTAAQRAADDIACAGALVRLGLDVKSMPAEQVVSKVAALDPAKQHAAIGACVGASGNAAQDFAGLLTRVKAMKAAHATP